MQGASNSGMLVAHVFLYDLHGSPVERLGLAKLALFVIDVSQRVEDLGHMHMLWPPVSSPLIEKSLVERLGLIVLALDMEKQCQV